jgi:hypothetical protein
MPTWTEAERFITTTGLAVFIVVVTIIGFAIAVRAAWSFVKPLIASWFAEQVKWFQAQTALMAEFIAYMQLTTKQHRQDRKAFISLGRAIHESASDEKKPAVKIHVDDLAQHFEDE